jgi:predicted metal-dependent hydrolase
MPERQITFGSKVIPFTLTSQDRKTLNIKVHPDSRIEVFAPCVSKESDIIKKIRTKAPWILKQLHYLESFKPKTPPRRFVNGETHLYLGRQYRLKIVQSEEVSVKAYRGQLIIKSQTKHVAKLETILDEWYKVKANLIFQDVLKDVLPRFAKYKVQLPVLYVRKMRKRWGSCTPAGKIILNPELIKAPKGSIEYVIVHELAHLVYHNHTKDFFNLQNRMMPDWRKWKDRLEYSLA